MKKEVKKASKDAIDRVSEAQCTWCASQHECQFRLGKEGSDPCVQYLAVRRAMKA